MSQVLSWIQIKPKPPCTIYILISEFHLLCVKTRNQFPKLSLKGCKYFGYLNSLSNPYFHMILTGASEVHLNFLDCEHLMILQLQLFQLLNEANAYQAGRETTRISCFLWTALRFQSQSTWKLYIVCFERTWKSLASGYFCWRFYIYKQYI